jgi:transcriptional regulator with XRE-family HTH domain
MYQPTGNPTPMNERQELGNRIHLARKRAKLTQSQLAERVNVSDSSITRYEGGVISMDVFLASRIAKETGVSLGWLCGHEAETAADISIIMEIAEILAPCNWKKTESLIKVLKHMVKNTPENF